MPGHKGTDFTGCEQYDITEINGADVLYMSEGIIKESEDNAASLFCTAKTFCRKYRQNRYYRRIILWSYGAMPIGGIASLEINF